jgi:prephenate dehydratase
MATDRSKQQQAELSLWYGAKRKSTGLDSPGGAVNSSSEEAGSGMKIAIQGEPGSFSHEAALKLVPGGEIAPFSLSADVFAAVAGGAVDAAVIPIENSLAGSVSEHFDLLLNHDVKVERETRLRIRHNLIALSGASVATIDRVFSHPVALAQCRKFLAEHPRMEAFAFYDTAGSVKQLVELRDRHAGAIASRAAAACYGAAILAADIEDNPENFTRFFLIRRSREVEQDSAANKISIAFSLENRPGSLVAALTAVSALGTNLTKIESRPVHGKPWEYIFYVDCQLHSPDEGDRALKALEPHCAMVKSLGCYREAEEAGLEDREQEIGNRE